jgi:hypothetical protein
MKKRFLYLLSMVVIVMVSCQKEVSFELGNEPAKGVLQDDVTGDCLPKIINGVYEASKVLDASNTITVSVDVTKTGIYTITTDTVNNYFFRGTGNFTTTGTNTVTLKGNGTPFAAGINNFIVSFDGSFCDVQIDVLPGGAGGPSEFTLVNGGTPPNCASAVVNGTYVKDIATNASNTVTIQVNVTKIGSYNISATGGGLTFTKSGAFTTTGVQPLVLNATGTPTTAGANTITFATPFASCNFSITVDAAAAFTMNCAGATVAGTYDIGVPLSASNTITIPVTVTTPGAYSVTGTGNGMTFTASGNLTAATTSIVLVGTSGSPTGPAGPQTITISNGSSNCTVTVTVTGTAPAVDWEFTVGTTTYKGKTVDASLDGTSGPPFTLFDYLGDNVAQDELAFLLSDIAGGVTANETYNTNIATLSNFAFFDFIGTGIELEANAATTPAVSILFRITSHTVATKTIVGTFSGTAKNLVSNAVVNVTNGKFTAVYQ